MKNSYYDILELSHKPPIWWDENAVPRFCDFDPEDKADIYANEVVLFEIKCQGCGHTFHVVHSANQHRICENIEYWPLAGKIITKMLHYGDPPNIECCSSGSTMNSEPYKVLEYWRLSQKTYHWVRFSQYEIDIKPDWVDLHEAVSSNYLEGDSNG